MIHECALQFNTNSNDSNVLMIPSDLCVECSPQFFHFVDTSILKCFFFHVKFMDEVALFGILHVRNGLPKNSQMQKLGKSTLNSRFKQACDLCCHPEKIPQHSPVREPKKVRCSQKVVDVSKKNLLCLEKFLDYVFAGNKRDSFLLCFSQNCRSTLCSVDGRTGV